MPAFPPLNPVKAQIQGALWGVLVADALGLPHQFKAASSIPVCIQMVMSSGYEKTFPKIAYGSWSDDGSLTLAMADSLASKGGVGKQPRPKGRGFPAEIRYA